MNRKEAEKWVCENTNYATWDEIRQRPYLLSNMYYLALKNLINESKSDNNPVPVVGADDRV